MLDFHIISPNGRLIISAIRGNTVYGIQRKPLKFELFGKNQSRLKELRRADLEWTVEGKLISLTADNQLLPARVLRSLLLDLVETRFPSQTGNRVKMPGYESLDSLDGTSPTKKAEVTFRNGYRIDPTGWSSDYATFPNINAALDASSTTITLANPGQTPTWVANRSTGGVGTTVGSALITADGINGLFSALDTSAKISGTGIPAGAVISSVESPLAATMSADATATGTVTASLKGGIMFVDEEPIFFEEINRTTGVVTGAVRNKGGVLAAAQSHAKGTRAFFMIPWEVYGSILGLALSWDDRDAQDIDGQSNEYGFTLKFSRGSVI